VREKPRRKRARLGNFVGFDYEVSKSASSRMSVEQSVRLPPLVVLQQVFRASFLKSTPKSNEIPAMPKSDGRDFFFTKKSP
jgi:hypothetical protein